MLVNQFDNLETEIGDGVRARQGIKTEGRKMVDNQKKKGICSYLFKCTHACYSIQKRDSRDKNRYLDSPSMTSYKTGKMETEGLCCT